MSTTTPTDGPALPDEVREAIHNCARALFGIGADRDHFVSVTAEEIIAALAPHWRRMEEEIARLSAWKEYAEGHGLLIGVSRTSDCPEGRLAHDYREGSSLQRMFSEWSDSIYLRARVAELEDSLAAARRDGERLDWLSMQCYLPGDHPDDGLLVVVSEKYAPLGSFTSSQKNDAKVFRAAIDSAMSADQEGKR